MDCNVLNISTTPHQFSSKNGCSGILTAVSRYAIAIGLVAACADQLSSWLRPPNLVPPFSDAVAAMTAVFAIALVASLAALTLVVVLGHTQKRMTVVHPVHAVGASLVMLAWIIGWTHYAKSSLSIGALVGLLIIAVPCALFSVTVFALLKSVDCYAGTQRYLETSVDVAPVVVVLGTIAASAFGGESGVSVFHPLSGAGLSSIGKPGLWVFGIVVTIFVGVLLFSRLMWKRRSTPLLLYGAATLLVVAGAASILRTTQGLTINQNEGVASPSGAVSSFAIRPNVILIAIETLRYDFVSFAGAAGYAKTPNIAALGEDSVVFRNAVSQSPWTLPAMASILTGYPPEKHGLVRVDDSLPDSLETLAEVLARHGYQTGAIGHQTFLVNPFYGFQRGFGHFDFHPKKYAGSPFPGSSYGAAILRRTFLPEPPDADELGREAIAWIDSQVQEPFFLWIHYFDPHATYDPPDRFLDEVAPRAFREGFVQDFKRPTVRLSADMPDPQQLEWLRALYAGEVAFVDESIGRLVAYLKDSNVYDDTLIILTSDHGEQFLEHGATHHGSSLHAEELRVPLIIKLPDSSLKKEAWERVTTTGITPAVLHLVGMETGRPNTPFQLLETLVGTGMGDRSPRPLVVGSNLYGEKQIGLYFEHYKYIYSVDSGREFLFDLRVDPREEHSIAVNAQEVIEAARQYVKDRVLNQGGDLPSGMDAAPESGQLPGDSQDNEQRLRERLRALGYL